MPLKHVQPTLRTAQASLQNLLPGLIAAYNAEPTTTRPLTVPEASRYFIPAEDPLGGGGGFPVVELYIGSGALGPFSIEKSKADMDDRCTVVIWTESDRGQLGELYEQVTGYGRCALQVLLQDNAFGVDVEIADSEGAVTYDYSVVPGPLNDPENRDSFQKWRTGALLTFKLEDVTDLP